MDPQTGALREKHFASYGGIPPWDYFYDDLVTFQGRFLPKHIRTYHGGKLHLEVFVDRAEEAPDLAMASFTPSPDAVADRGMVGSGFGGAIGTFAPITSTKGSRLGGLFTLKELKNNDSRLLSKVEASYPGATTQRTLGIAGER